MIIPTIATRGLIFSATIESLKRNEVDLNSLVVVAGKNIPDGPNECITQALSAPSMPDYILSVEDDMAIPDGAVKAMEKMGKAIVCIDYPVAGGWSTISRKNGVIQHCGLGCTLIHRNVFRDIGFPYFKTDKSINANTGETLDIPNKYGGHDIWFFKEAREHGFEITQLEGYEAKHMRCEQLNRIEFNNGQYNIYPLPQVENRQE